MTCHVFLVLSVDKIRGQNNTGKLVPYDRGQYLIRLQLILTVEVKYSESLQCNILFTLDHS